MHLTWVVVHKFDASCLDFFLQIWEGAGQGMHLTWAVHGGVRGCTVFLGGNCFCDWLILVLVIA